MPKVLLVDDSAANRAVLRRALANGGADIVEAENGHAAIEVANAAAADIAVILLDVDMPELDGFEVARQLRAYGKTASTPIIFVTAAFTDPDHQRYGYALGAADYLVNKPVDPAMVRQKVGVFLQLFRERAELKAQMEQISRENQRLAQEKEEYRAAQEQLRRMAMHDPLTDLPNRLLFEDHLRQAMERASRNGTHFALMFIDLDKLKEVNDQYGHAAGDRLITGIARRLVANVRGAGSVARLGGDEFGLLLENLQDPSIVDQLGRKVHRVIAQEMNIGSTLGGKDVTVTPDASIGIALYPDHATGRDDLLVRADLAMYQVKERGGGGVNVYIPRQPAPQA